MKRSCLFLLATFATFATACAQSEDPVPAGSDTGVPGDSSGETSTDTPIDTPSVCTPGDIESRACGKCGKQKRACGTGTWGDWKACEDEIATAECAIGETRETDCGNCGKQKDTCDPAACTWVDGSCGGEGECAPGDVDTTTASCTTAGEIRTRTCDDKCKYSAFGACALPTGWVSIKSPPTSFVGRYGGIAVYTGKEPLLWGGVELDSFGDTNSLADGATYDVGGDTWTVLPAAPTALSGGRMFPSGVYGASKVLIWGGMASSGGSFTLKADGARYDPVGKSWSAMTSTGAPSARFGAGAVWSTTTNEMIVWGGCTAEDGSGTCTAFAKDGAAYDPAGDKWTALPAVPSGFSGRSGHSMEWSGTEVIIWGGGDDTTEFKDGLRYDPSAKTWTTMTSTPSTFSGRVGHASVWSGKELIVFGGSDFSGTFYDDGARYLPGGSWTLMATPTSTELPTAARYLSHAWYGASKLWVWSGIDDFYTELKGGASYDATTDKWTAMPSKNEPSPRGSAMVVWTGKEALVWGGVDFSSYTVKKDGAIFRP